MVTLYLPACAPSSLPPVERVYEPLVIVPEAPMLLRQVLRNEADITLLERIAVIGDGAGDGIAFAETVIVCRKRP